MSRIYFHLFLEICEDLEIAVRAGEMKEVKIYREKFTLHLQRATLASKKKFILIKWSTVRAVTGTVQKMAKKQKNAQPVMGLAMYREQREVYLV